MNKIFKNLIYLLPFVFSVLLILLIYFRLKGVSPITTFQPAPSPTPTVSVDTSSRWSTDSGILKLENDFSSAKSQIDSLNFDQSLLFPPELNFGLGISP